LDLLPPPPPPGIDPKELEKLKEEIKEDVKD